jgi:hypothetical protein
VEEVEAVWGGKQDDVSGGKVEEGGMYGRSFKGGCKVDQIQNSKLDRPGSDWLESPSRSRASPSPQHTASS